MVNGLQEKEMKEKRGNRKKKFMILLVVLLFIFLQINYVSAVGISPAKRTINYQPGQTERFSYGIWNTEKTESSVTIEAIGGKLRENIVFSETEINFSAGETMRQIEGAMSFPDSMIEQDEFIDIVAKETQKKGAFVNVQLEVKSRIDIKAPPKKQTEELVKEEKKEVKEEKPEQKTEENKTSPIKKENEEINEDNLNKILAGVLIVLVIMQVYLTIYQVSLAKQSAKKKTKSKKKSKNKKWKKNKRRN